MGTVTTANGAWSANISTAGCTSTPFNVQTQAVSRDGTAAGALQSTMNGASPNTISGSVTQASTISLLGVLSINLFASASATINVEAWCN